MRGFVGHDVSFAGDICADDRENVGLLDAFNVERTGRTACGQPGSEPRSCGQKPRLTSKPSFLPIKVSSTSTEFASAAHRRQGTITHRLTDTVSEEPSGFHTAREHPLDLIGRYAFLAGAHQMDDLKPKVQRQVREFKDGPLAHSKLALALIALAKAEAGGFAWHLANALLVGIAAMRANWAIRPELALDVVESGFFVFESGGR